MATKKVFAPIMTLLAANMGATVGDIYADVEALTSAKTGGGGGKATTFHKDEEGNVVAVQCYYHQKWFDPRVVDFGKKATSPTGLDRFTKHGLSMWTKQQAACKKATAEVYARLLAEEISNDEARELIAKAEAEKSTIVDHPEGGFETLEELLASA
jgi:hypothetical protein